MDQVPPKHDGGKKPVDLPVDLEESDGAVIGEEPDSPIAIEAPQEPNDWDGQPV